MPQRVTECKKREPLVEQLPLSALFVVLSYYLRLAKIGNRIRRSEVPPMLSALKSQRDTETLRLERVRQLFVTHHPRQRTVNNVLRFFLWLRQNKPELLSHENHSASYQLLKVDLLGLYVS